MGSRGLRAKWFRYVFCWGWAPWGQRIIEAMVGLKVYGFARLWGSVCVYDHFYEAKVQVKIST